MYRRASTAVITTLIGALLIAAPVEAAPASPSQEKSSSSAEDQSAKKGSGSSDFTGDNYTDKKAVGSSKKVRHGLKWADENAGQGVLSILTIIAPIAIIFIVLQHAARLLFPR